MNFIDQAKVNVQAGKGGNGKISFRKEKFISHGGPDGGDGGDGGDVILKASFNQDSLAVFRFTKQLTAELGQPGGNNHKHGRNGQDLIVAVPVGTEARDEQEQVIADMTFDGQTCVIANGGKGGFGNSHFVSSKRQAPNFADRGEPGDIKRLTFELKMLADVGLVGQPNAGKSTLLTAVSNAKPKIANYPFTTLNPSVGVVEIDNKNSLLMADIPGLIEGAALGKGLGHDFLRHIERTSVIIHVLDAYDDNIASSYQIIRQELGAYRKELLKRPEIIVINKVEAIDKEIVNDIIRQLRLIVKPKSTPILAISAQSGQGLKELILATKIARDKVTAKLAAKPKKEIYEYRLPDNDLAWDIAEVSKGQYLVTGVKIEKFALRTDFANDQAVARLLNILKKRGIMHALIRSGLKPGHKISIADKGEITY